MGLSLLEHTYSFLSLVSLRFFLMHRIGTHGLMLTDSFVSVRETVELWMIFSPNKTA